jgi:hypothetical protein
MTTIAIATLAGAIWMFSFAPAYAQATTEYLGTVGQSAGQGQPLGSLGSSIANSFHGAGQAIDSGNTNQSYGSNSEGQSQTLDSGGSSGSRPVTVKVPVQNMPVQDAQKPDAIDYSHNPNLGY